MTSSYSKNLKNAKLMVVEDNDDQWFMIYHAIRQSLGEVKVSRVNAPQYAKDLLAEWIGQDWEIPKLILLDLYLPTNQEGWRLLSYIKAMPEPFNRIPVVMLSSSEAPADIKEAYDLGISSYLVKPINVEDWVNLFQELRAYWWETVSLPPIRYTF